jgi:hypothetical protein
MKDTFDTYLVGCGGIEYDIALEGIERRPGHSSDRSLPPCGKAASRLQRTRNSATKLTAAAGLSA